MNQASTKPSPGNIVFEGSAAPPVGRLCLWYRRPASLWTEANPLGNGRIGAMVFGGVDQERLQLNEATLWAGGPYDPSHDDAYPALEEIRSLIFNRKYKEADKLISEKFMARPLGQMPYQTAGDLHLSFPLKGQVLNYRRDLDLETAISTIAFTHQGVHYTRETFVSAPDNVLVIKISADKPGSVSFEASLACPLSSSARSEGRDELILAGEGGKAWGIPGAIRFENRLKVLAQGGKMENREGKLQLRSADSALLLLSLATNYRGFQDLSADPSARNRQALSKAAAKSFEKLKKEHLCDYQALFKRVSLDLGATAQAQKPTDERIAAFSAGGDPQLAELYFQFARYLLISCSRPGGQPATLQGLWNESIDPPWGSKYTININTEMNYWPAEAANLAECHLPLFQALQELSWSGRRTAQRQYHARGWVCHHNMDLWRATGPIDGPAWGMWPMGGAWLATHLWAHYEYGQDKAFLAWAYPIIKGAAEFFVDTLIPEPKHGWLVTCPSISPENQHPGGSAACAGPSMDLEILRDLFTQCMAASEILGQDKDFRDELGNTLKKLAPLQIGQAGQLQEWLDDWDLQAPERDHRHVSHLYGLFPSSQITRQSNPACFEAARKSLELRGDAGTGWSLAWKINLWARLGDGEHSYKMLANLISPERTYPNLFDAHPPFQIDGNFGGCSGIIQMLLQCRDGEIVLLPALPSAWPNGHARGLRAAGGYEVDLSWREGKLESATLHSKLGLPANIRWGEKVVRLGANPAREVTYRLNSHLELVS